MELLTGQLPFDSPDALKLVYEHLAATPIPPYQINSDIPLILSEIVIKLLAKNADDRDQSAQGVQVDLEQCVALSGIAHGDFVEVYPGQLTSVGHSSMAWGDFDNDSTVQVQVGSEGVVPEPSTVMLLSLGIVGLCALLR